MAMNVTIRFGVNGGPPRKFSLPNPEEGRIRIGRNPKSEVHVDLPGTSWKHAEIWLRGSEDSRRLILLDHSSNGTGLKAPTAESVARVTKGEETDLPSNSLVVMPMKIKVDDGRSVQDQMDQRLCFVVEIGGDEEIPVPAPPISVGMSQETPAPEAAPQISVQQPEEVKVATEQPKAAEQPREPEEEPKEGSRQPEQQPKEPEQPKSQTEQPDDLKKREESEKPKTEAEEPKTEAEEPKDRKKSEEKTKESRGKSSRSKSRRDKDKDKEKDKDKGRRRSPSRSRKRSRSRSRSRRAGNRKRSRSYRRARSRRRSRDRRSRSRDRRSRGRGSRDRKSRERRPRSRSRRKSKSPAKSRPKDEGSRSRSRSKKREEKEKKRERRVERQAGGFGNFSSGPPAESTAPAGLSEDLLRDLRGGPPPGAAPTPADGAAAAAAGAGAATPAANTPAPPEPGTTGSGQAKSNPGLPPGAPRPAPAPAAQSGIFSGLGGSAASNVEPCGDYRRGACTRGDNCKYSHGDIPTKGTREAAAAAQAAQAAAGAPAATPSQQPGSSGFDLGAAAALAAQSLMQKENPGSTPAPAPAAPGTGRPAGGIFSAEGLANFIAAPPREEDRPTMGSDVEVLQNGQWKLVTALSANDSKLMVMTETGQLEVPWSQVRKPGGAPLTQAAPAAPAALAVAAPSPPSSTGTTAPRIQDCNDFKRNACTRGDNCRFLHGDVPTRGSREAAAAAAFEANRAAAAAKAAAPAPAVPAILKQPEGAGATWQTLRASSSTGLPGQGAVRPMGQMDPRQSAGGLQGPQGFGAPCGGMSGSMSNGTVPSSMGRVIMPSLVSSSMPSNGTVPGSMGSGGTAGSMGGSMPSSGTVPGSVGSGGMPGSMGSSMPSSGTVPGSMGSGGMTGAIGSSMPSSKGAEPRSTGDPAMPDAKSSTGMSSSMGPQSIVNAGASNPATSKAASVQQMQAPSNPAVSKAAPVQQMQAPSNPAVSKAAPVQQMQVPDGARQEGKAKMPVPEPAEPPRRPPQASLPEPAQPPWRAPQVAAPGPLVAAPAPLAAQVMPPLGQAPGNQLVSKAGATAAMTAKAGSFPNRGPAVIAPKMGQAFSGPPSSGQPSSMGIPPVWGSPPAGPPSGLVGATAKGGSAPWAQQAQQQQGGWSGVAAPTQGKAAAPTLVRPPGKSLQEMCGDEQGFMK